MATIKVQVGICILSILVAPFPYLCGDDSLKGCFYNDYYYVNVDYKTE